MGVEVEENKIDHEDFKMPIKPEKNYLKETGKVVDEAIDSLPKQAKGIRNPDKIELPELRKKIKDYKGINNDPANNIHKN